MIDGLIILLGGFLAYKMSGVSESIWGGDVRALIKSVKSMFPSLSYIPDDLILSIAKIESDFEPTATSEVGASGLMQVMPSTFAWLRDTYGQPWLVNIYDPFENMVAGMFYLHYLYCDLKDWSGVIQAYNVGLGGYKKGVRNWDYYTKVWGLWAVA